MKFYSIITPVALVAAVGLSGCSKEVPPPSAGGVYRSESAGALFEQSVQVTTTEGEYIAQFPLQNIHRPAHDPQSIYIAAGEQGIVISHDDGVSWKIFPTPLTFATDVIALQSGVLVAAGRDAGGQGYVVRSLDEGKSWHAVFTVPTPVNEESFKLVGGNGQSASSVVLTLEPDPFNADRIYGGTSLGSLFIGEQAAKVWRTFYTVQPEGPAIAIGSKQMGIRTLVVSPHTPGELLVITESKRLLRITNNTQTAIEVPAVIGIPKTPFLSGGERDVLDVSYIVGFPQALLVGVNDGAVVTRDGGQSWLQLSVPVEVAETFNSVVVRTSPTNANRIFVAINGVVYRSEDGGQAWNTFSLGLPNYAIHDISINPTNAAKALLVVHPLAT
ncbi:MAG: hypothetical protein HYR90_04645 [Candidatus Andersenbacteria bacterium]|nr:hypothetical protein [Candidatus Andersenbacteria bacterium]MBI3250439.1 hypothetical protein [Candidatus Andersenbacteria bacterium]